MGQVIGSLLMRLLGKQEVGIMMVSLYDAGKTTILYKLKLDKIIQTTHTTGCNVEVIDHKNTRFRIWDIGGDDQTRALWPRFYHASHKCQAVIFVLDSRELEDVAEAQYELACLMKRDEMRDAVLLIYANKQDLPGALRPDQLKQELGLDALLKGHRWHIQGASAVQNIGLHEGLDWLIEELALGPKNITTV